MSDNINEALLEMHFHSAIVKHFSNLFGASFLRILKPVPQREAWVGFDQGWVYTKVSNTDLINQIRTAIASNATAVTNFYIGYFLQFKIVQKMTSSSKLKPPGYSTPYFRSELDLVPNKTTKISQHETLKRLSTISGASVSYACGMLFDLDEIYQPPDLGKLRCVPISTSPTGWATNQRHFIVFQNTSDPSPSWCSDPVKGVSMPFDEWASLDSKYGPHILTATQILEMIESAVTELNGKIKHATTVLPENFTLIEFGRDANLEIEENNKQDTPKAPGFKQSI